MDKVWVVCHDKYGDQGSDFRGAFSTKELAEQYTIKQQPDEHERQWWDIYEVIIDEECGK